MGTGLKPPVPVLSCPGWNPQAHAKRGTAILVALLAVPLGLQLAVADTVPSWDVTPSCRGAAEAGFMLPDDDRLKTCIESENRTRDQLKDQWSSFEAGDRARCVQSIRWFAPTYTELVSCLEMAKFARERPPKGAETTGSATRAAPATR